MIQFANIGNKWAETTKLVTLQEINISHLGEKENHLQICFIKGYVNSLEGIQLRKKFISWEPICSCSQVGVVSWKCRGTTTSLDSRVDRFRALPRWTARLAAVEKCNDCLARSSNSEKCPKWTSFKQRSAPWQIGKPYAVIEHSEWLENPPCIYRAKHAMSVYSRVTCQTAEMILKFLDSWTKVKICEC